MKTDDSRTVIQHAYNRGEYEIQKKNKQGTWKVDGYAQNQNGRKIYEFNGCEFHSGCPFCKPEDKQSEHWIRKMKEFEESSFTVEVMWECQFKKLLPSIQSISTPDIGGILSSSQSEAELIRGIETGELFGFLVCDIECSPDAITRFHNYPPIVSRLLVTNEHLTPFMAEEIKRTYEKESFSRETLVQRFNATQYLLFSPVAEFYLKNGINISNVTAFYQYQPSPILKGFADKVTDMRIAAEKAVPKNKTKSLTAKIFGNSGYGKVNFIFRLFLMSLILISN